MDEPKDAMLDRDLLALGATVQKMEAIAPRPLSRLSRVVLAPPCRGGNQGLIKIITHGVDKDPECKPPTPVHESKLSARLDGGKSAGMLVMSKAMEIAITKVSIRIRSHLQVDCWT